MIVLETIGYSLLVIIVTAGTLLFMMGGPRYAQRSTRSTQQGAARQGRGPSVGRKWRRRLAVGRLVRGVSRRR